MDIIGTGQQATNDMTEDALRRASKSTHTPRGQILIWVDQLGGPHEHTFTGITADRLAYMEQHRIDVCPFVFAYMADGEAVIGGNDDGLRKQLDALLK